MIRRPPRSTQSRSSAASDVYKRQPLWIGFSPKLVALLSHPAGGEGAEAHSGPVDAGGGAVHAGRGDIPPTMDLLLDVELPVSVSFGKTEIPMKDVLKLSTGCLLYTSDA